MYRNKIIIFVIIIIIEKGMDIHWMSNAKWTCTLSHNQLYTLPIKLQLVQYLWLELCNLRHMWSRSSSVYLTYILPGSINGHQTFIKITK